MNWTWMIEGGYAHGNLAKRKGKGAQARVDDADKKFNSSCEVIWTERARTGNDNVQKDWLSRLAFMNLYFLNLKCTWPGVLARWNGMAGPTEHNISMEWSQ